MTIHYEYITNIYYSLIEDEIKQRFDGKNRTIAFNKYKKINDKSTGLKYVLKAFKSDKLLCKLTDSIALIETYYTIDNFESNNKLDSLEKQLAVLRNKMASSNNKRIWVLLWAILQKTIIDHRLYCDKDIAQFYIDLFENNYITILQEDCTERLVQTSIFFKDKYLHILEKAVSKHSEIGMLQNTLMFVYWSKANYIKYLPFISSNIEKSIRPSKNEDKDTLEPYLTLLSYRLITYSKLNMINETLNDIKLIYSLLPNIEILSNDKLYIAYYRQCLITSVSIHLKQNNNDSLVKDLAVLKKHINLEKITDWADYYPEAVRYIQDNLK